MYHPSFERSLQSLNNPFRWYSFCSPNWEGHSFQSIQKSGRPWVLMYICYVNTGVLMIFQPLKSVKNLHLCWSSIAITEIKKAGSLFSTDQIPSQINLHPWMVGSTAQRSAHPWCSDQRSTAWFYLRQQLSNRFPIFWPDNVFEYVARPCSLIRICFAIRSILQSYL